MASSQPRTIAGVRCGSAAVSYTGGAAIEDEKLSLLHLTEQHTRIDTYDENFEQLTLTADIGTRSTQINRN